MQQIRYSIVTLLLLFVGSPAFALCFEPSSPSAPYGSAPSPPYCGSYGDLSDCSEWEIETYRAEVDDHIRKMKRYADEASQFSSEAIDYAQCEINDVVDEWNSFAGR